MAETEEKTRNEVERNWCDLPQDLLSLIKTRLFAGDYSAFSGVCRSWRSTTCLVRPLPPPIDGLYRHYPCLMSIHNDMVQVFHPVYNDFYYMDIPELCGANILSSRYGWLLVSIRTSIFFFNPFTREKIALPDIPFGFSCACFTLPPTSRDCSVIGASGMFVADIAIFRHGYQSWDTFEFEAGARFLCADCSPVLFNGLYYVLSIDGNVGVFDPSNPSNWKIFVEPFDPEYRNSLLNTFLLELDGKLVCACVSLDYEVRFLSIDFSNEIWQPEVTIGIGGDEILHASRGSTFFRRAVVNGMSRKIYFPMFCGTNGAFYSLGTKRFHSFAGDSSTGVKITRRLPFGVWIEPTFGSGKNLDLSPIVNPCSYANNYCLQKKISNIRRDQKRIMDIGITKKLVDHHELPQSSYPWLIHGLIGGSEVEEQTLHNIFENESFTTNIPYLSNNYVWSSSCHGWWVVQDFTNDDPCFILNPVSMERIELPAMEKQNYCEACILSDAPRNPDSRILFSRGKTILFCRVGDDEFKEHMPGQYLVALTVAHGIIYGLLASNLTYELVIISFEGRDDLKITRVIRDEEEFHSLLYLETFRFEDYLIESDNELWHVHKTYSMSFSYETVDFKIHKLDNSSCSKWERVKSIGEKRVLLLDWHSGMFCDIDEEEGLKGNCIYYVDEHSNHLHVFYLEDGSISSSSLSPSSTIEANYSKHNFSWIILPSPNSL